MSTRWRWGLVLLLSMFAAAAINEMLPKADVHQAQQQKSPDQEKTQKATELEARANAALATILAHGYDCAKVVSINPNMWDDGMSLSCRGSNGHLYGYEVVDRGGKLFLKVD